MKHIELFKDGFNDTINEKIQPENWPYVGNDGVSSEIVYTLVSEENQSEYQMVDLGLSVKWADRNVGASSHEDNGLYFSWGNVDGHAVDENGNITDGYLFDADTYSTTLGGQYTSSPLDAEHDAATVNMGDGWRMPTVTETTELVENTDHYYIGEDGSVVAGPFNHETNNLDKGLDDSTIRSICFVKKGDPFDYNVRGNFIEFPFAGYGNGSSLVGKGSGCCVWSSSMYNDSGVGGAHNLYADKGGYITGRFSINSYYGMSIRGVHA